MSPWKRTLGLALMGFGLLLGGCAGMAHDARPGMAPAMSMDGQQFDLQDPVENGRAQILTGQYGLAADTLLHAVQQDPHNARALTLLAVAYGQVKRFDLADRYHAQALEADPNSVAALNNWGYSYLVRGDKVRAADLLQRAVAVSDGRPIVAANLALVRGDGPAEPMPAQAAVTDPMRSVRLSEHVTLVRPTGRLVRWAPGVQLLLTNVQGPVDAQGSADAQAPTPLPASAPAAQKASLQPAWPLATVDPLAGVTDTRFELFRALFALVEGEAGAGASAPASHQLADASPSPFGYFPDVDDFTRQ
jgi:tetratricopeptide (TPR) repeat protein